MEMCMYTFSVTGFSFFFYSVFYIICIFNFKAAGLSPYNTHTESRRVSQNHHPIVLPIESFDKIIHHVGLMYGFICILVPMEQSMLAFYLAQTTQGGMMDKNWKFEVWE